ncbi:Protein SapB [Paenibacillus sp. CECT 9249]|nr:Protein SapB [Paenibacillus sp. CECT 9249]
MVSFRVPFYSLLNAIIAFEWRRFYIHQRIDGTVMEVQYAYLFRILVAGICGALIGYERKSRMKEAGIRTHLIVAIGSALMMVISKYGFQDQASWTGVGLDPSRVAAQVVSGIGFLGAGMIFMQKQTIKGLTTAAGVWATSGIGMTIGAGLYWVGLGVTLMILIAQKVLHSGFHWLATPKTEQIHIRIDDTPGVLDEIQTALKEKHIIILHFQAERNAGDMSELELELTVKLPAQCNTEQLFSIIQAIPAIKAFEVQ